MFVRFIHVHVTFLFLLQLVIEFLEENPHEAYEDLVDMIQVSSWDDLLSFILANSLVYLLWQELRMEVFFLRLSYQNWYRAESVQKNKAIPFPGKEVQPVHIV